MPTPVEVPEAEGETRRRRVRGPGGKKEERRTTWFVEGRGEKKGKAERKGSEIALACYNIRDGRNTGLLSAARALDHANVDVAFLQEVKMMNPKFASRSGYGYTIVTTGAGTARCGGVSLLSRKSDLFSIEEAKPWGPNVISWEMQVGEEK